MIVELKKDKENMTKKLSGIKFLIGSKHVILDQIINSLKIVSPHLHMVKKTMTLCTNVHIQINRAYEELANKHQVADEMIKYLNGRNIVKTFSLGVFDMTMVIMEVIKAYAKKNLIQHAQAKCNLVKRFEHDFLKKNTCHYLK